MILFIQVQRLIRTFLQWIVNYGFARFGSNSDTGLLCGSSALNVNDLVSHSNWNYGVSLTCLRGIINGFARFGSCSNDSLLVGSFACNLNNPVANSEWNYGVSLYY